MKAKGIHFPAIIQNSKYKGYKEFKEYKGGGIALYSLNSLYPLYSIKFGYL